MPSLAQLFCAAWGHHVDNREFRSSAARDRCCRCGAEYLGTTGQATRVGHTLSCFLGHHTYQRLIDRDGYHEYVCVRCGHPLLFAADTDPYASSSSFDKKVHYLCGLLGHRVRAVTTRQGLVEYACFCGHTFLRAERNLTVIRHPAICVVAGHWITFVAKRAGYSEYICRSCGHPFCFADPVARPSPPPRLDTSADLARRRTPRTMMT
jgi:DNA-directed RNA polymerase subunit RPC12/RpoP